MEAAAKATGLVFKNYLVDELAQIIDSEKKVTHERLATKCEQFLFDEKGRRRLQLPSDVCLISSIMRLMSLS
jgi:nucleosome binding factor SPN SPT16 subunit